MKAVSWVVQRVVEMAGLLVSLRAEIMAVEMAVCWAALKVVEMVF